MDDLELQVHSSIKEIEDMPSNKEILEALRTVVNIPDEVLSVTLAIDSGKRPMLTFVTYAKKAGNA